LRLCKWQNKNSEMGISLFTYLNISVEIYL
jgi:hypothetical protein